MADTPLPVHADSLPSPAKEQPQPPPPEADQPLQPLHTPNQSTPASKKRRRNPSAATPITTDRPSRDRKLVDRYSASPSSLRTSASKSVSIQKGSGTQLRDIPNVAFKLSKNKADDKMQSLHKILFGKKAKAHTLKRNIGQFSGFVWNENEEKQRAKVRQKLDKCFKEKLLYFCELLNIRINKATAKKEGLSEKLLEFLESPHSTTDVILADKQQKRQRKSTPNKSLSSAEVSTEKQKKRAEVDKKEKTSSAAVEEETKDDDDKSNSDAESDSIGVSEEDNEEMHKNDAKSEEHDDAVDETDARGVLDIEKTKDGKEGESRENSEPVKQESYAKSAKIPSTSMKESSKLNSNDDSADGLPGSPAKSEGLNSKMKVENDSTEEKGASSKGKSLGKRSNKLAPEASAKKRGTSKNSKKKAGPSREEMHKVVVGILKEVDFNTATLSDILKLLGSHFDVDLHDRKAEVKEIITEVINNMSDEEDDEEEDSDE